MRQEVTYEYVESLLFTYMQEQRAMDIAELLNLQKSLDNVVGSALLKGISGKMHRSSHTSCAAAISAAWIDNHFTLQVGRSAG